MQLVLDQLPNTYHEFIILDPSLQTLLQFLSFCNFGTGIFAV